MQNMFILSVINLPFCMKSLCLIATSFYLLTVYVEGYLPYLITHNDTHTHTRLDSSGRVTSPTQTHAFERAPTGIGFI